MQKTNAARALLWPSTLESVAYRRETTAHTPSAIEERRGSFRDDPALVRACLSGDEDAWRELVDKYGRLVYWVARHNGLSEVDADDVFQIVFTIALQQLRTLRNKRCLCGWLASIANWQSLRLVRRTRVFSELDESIEDENTSVSDEAVRWERQEMVRQAIDRLDPRDREIIYRLFSESPQTYAEIAAHLRTPEGSIGPTRARCLERLRKIIHGMNIDLDF